jgi:hypothetical protein
MGKLKAVKMETLAAFLSFHSISFPSEWGGEYIVFCNPMRHWGDCQFPFN